MTDSALAKVDRASKHIADLNDLFRKSRPFSYVVETNQKSGYCFTYAERNEAVICEATTIAGDAVQNLRAALDHAYWEIVSPFASNPREERAIQFPFSETLARLDEAVKNRLAHRVSDAFFKAVINLRPYGEPGGNILLYLVHDLGATDRHKFPTPVADYKEIVGRDLRRQVPHFPASSDHTRFQIGNVTSASGGRVLDIRWKIAPLGFLDREFTDKREIDIPVEIVFSVRAEGARYPMVPTLYAMRDKTQEAIKIIRSA
jgi:hypothetical protein